jgi:histone-lysine N-methyltransferase SUV39H
LTSLLGVFAGSQRIFGGTFIGVYAGELLCEAVAEQRGHTYNKFGRTYLLDIDFHHLKDERGVSASKYTVDAYHAGNVCAL